MSCALLSLSTIAQAQNQYVLAGTAVTNGSTSTEQCFVLNKFEMHSEGAVWNSSMINLSNSFTVNTRLWFGSGLYPGQADGIAFVLQRTGNNIVGLDGGGIGYGGITPSFVIEFDTYQNIDQGFNMYDPVADHVGFMKNGDPSHMTGALKAPEAINIEIENGQWHNVSFNWNATTKVMTVTGFGQTFTYSGDIVNTIFGGNAMVYWGLTAATGSVDNVAYQACIENLVTPPPPPILNCGQLRTQTPGGWGAKPAGNNPGTYLHANFAQAFPNGLTIGYAPMHTVTFTSAQAITNYLPGGGTPAKLTMDHTNPATTDLKNSLVSHMLALTLSVVFDDKYANFAPSGVVLGDMIIESGAFAGWTVRAFWAEANIVLGGGTSMYTVQQVHSTASAINENYVDGSRDNGYLDCPNNGVVQRGVAPVTEMSQVVRPAGALRTYPNPTTGQFQLQLDELNGGNVQIEIAGANGNIVERRSAAMNKGQMMKFDLSRQAAGIYLIRIISDAGVRTQKIVVQK